MKTLDDCPQKTRVQFKTPYPLRVEDVGQIVNGTPYGENVTLIERRDEGSIYVYKEYCYHLRESSSIMKPVFLIDEKNQKRPPPSELLEALGSPYDAWEVHNGPFGISVLRYPYIEGTSENPTVKGWSKILEQVKLMHGINFVHGDLLPRNVIFKDDDEGDVIDFDLSRQEGSPYVQGFNYTCRCKRTPPNEKGTRSSFLAADERAFLRFGLAHN